LIALPGAAWAHSPVPGIRGFYLGLAHPFTEPAVVLALLSLGLVLGQRGADAFRKAWLRFAISLVLGLAIAFTAKSVMEPYAFLLVITFLLGLFATSALPLPKTAAFAIGAPVGYFVAISSMPDPGPWRAVAFSVTGNVLGINLLLLFTTGSVLHLREEFDRWWLAIGFRVIGSWIAAISGLMIALTFAAR